MIPSSRSAPGFARALRGLLIVSVAALVPVVAGCEAGQNAPTQRWHQPTPGAFAVVNNTIRVNNLFVLGPVPGATLPVGASASVFFALANNGPRDRLISISAPGSATSVQLPSGGVSLGKFQSVLLTGPVPKVVLQGLTRSLQGGQFIKMVLNFQDAGLKTISVPVIPHAQYFSTFSPAPVSPSPSPSHTGKHSTNKARATPTPSPSSTG